MTVPIDARVVYVVAAFEYDYLIACNVLRLQRASDTVWIRTGDITAPFAAMTADNAIVWLFGLWTRDTPPAELEAFAIPLNAAKNRGVLVDTF